MRRVVIPELLDCDAGSHDEIATSLADLRLINRWFGGVSTSLDLVRRIARAQRMSQFSLLEVGSGPGDAIEAIRKRLQSDAINLDVTLVDRAASHFSGALNCPRRIVADALALPFADGSFDLVSCALFLHHLEPAEVVTFVREALRVSRVAVLLNDLRRSAVSLALVYAGFPLFRSRLTRHDGPASVRRAYTEAELRSMLSQVNAGHLEITRHYL